MNMFKNLLVLILISFVTVGCRSTTKKLGTIGGVEFYAVHASHFDGPNLTALVSRSPSNEVVVNYVFGSAGIGSSIVAASGQIAASAALGISMPADKFEVSGGNSSANSGANSSSSSTANAANNSNNITNRKNGNGYGHDKDHDKDKTSNESRLRGWRW